MITEEICCYHCGGEHIVKNGVAPNGKQKYGVKTAASRVVSSPARTAIRKNVKRRYYALTKSAQASGDYHAPSASPAIR
jgi:hypothetical protein